jgi:hypothetical protein
MGFPFQGGNVVHSQAGIGAGQPGLAGKWVGQVMDYAWMMNPRRGNRLHTSINRLVETGLQRRQFQVFGAVGCAQL